MKLCIGWCITIRIKEVLTPMKRQKKGQAAPRRAAALAMALFAFVLAAGAAGGWGEITAGSIGAAVLRAELAAWNSDRTEERSPLGVLTALAMQDSAMLQSNHAAAEAAAQEDSAADGDSAASPDETHEGTVIDPEDNEAAEVNHDNDNGVPAKTIHPTNSAGYLVWKDVYISNTTDYNVDLDALMKTRPAAVFTDEMPQILILHTHATESYTMPEGQEYNDDGATRTEDTDYNVVRVGDEIAEVFEEAGISVLHDRTLYDAAGYNDAYDRAETSIQAYLEKYPSIHFVLDIHRDAIEDSDGNTYKVISDVNGKNAAQLSIVVGSDGSGLPHGHWQENLKLAVLLQQNLLEDYPTLMRPMYLRNSRYNEHATTGSLLVEVGAAGNSLDEALYAARLFAENMVEVLQTLR